MKIAFALFKPGLLDRACRGHTLDGFERRRLILFKQSSFVGVHVSQTPSLSQGERRGSWFFSMALLRHLMVKNSLLLPALGAPGGHAQLSRKSVACWPNSVWYWNRNPCPESG